MRLPCEQFREKAVTTDEFTATSWCECGFTKGAHEIATLVRAEQAEALAAKDREIVELRRSRIGDSEIIGHWMGRAEQAEAQMATLTARVTALETALQTAMGALADIGSNADMTRAQQQHKAQRVYGSLTQEPTP